MHCKLKSLIKIAGFALEVEDRLFLGDIAANQVAYNNESGGILRINNERYYQFIIARALTSSYPFNVTVEHKTHDLVLRYPDNLSKWFAVVEIKRWMSNRGNIEQDRISKDIEKLQRVNAENALILIISANPKKSTEKNLGELSKELGLTQNEDSSIWNWYSFPTIDCLGHEVEFFIAGHEINLFHTHEMDAENQTPEDNGLAL